MVLEEWIIYASNYEDFLVYEQNHRLNFSLKIPRGVFCGLKWTALRPSHQTCLSLLLTHPACKGVFVVQAHSSQGPGFFSFKSSLGPFSPNHKVKGHSIDSFPKCCLLYDSLPVVPYGRNYISKFHRMRTELIILLQTHCLIDRKHAF